MVVASCVRRRSRKPLRVRRISWNLVAKASLANGFANGAIPFSRCPLPMTSFSAQPAIKSHPQIGTRHSGGGSYLATFHTTGQVPRQLMKGALMKILVPLLLLSSTAGAADTAAVTAIDILLQPDSTMLLRAEDNNARLLKVFPKGFALDATHRPHITVIQRYVRTADLDKVYAAANKVLAAANVNGIRLEAFKYYYIPSKDIGLAGIVARPIAELLKLQQDLIVAVTPFTVETGDSSAFVTTPDDPVIDPSLIQYVSTFVPKASGDNFNPHVTTGVAPREYLDRMLAEPFESFTFSPAGAAVYQLGQFGTAAKKLKEWDLKP